jgi:hypothetical protein
MRAIGLFVIINIGWAGCNVGPLPLSGSDAPVPDLGAPADLAASPAPDLLVPACGGLAGIGCPTGFFCEYPAGMCANDGFGLCVRLPDTCGHDWAPVCGCDQKTYADDCLRRRAGVPLLHDGACDFPCGASSCRGDQICVEGCCGVPGCIPPVPTCTDAPPACNGHPSCACAGVGSGPDVQCSEGQGVLVQYFNCP